VLQPVIDLTTGRAIAAEGLTRFTIPSPAGPERTTAQWFDDAARLGLRQELEVATATTVLDLLDDPGLPDGTAVTVNLGPTTITSPAFVQLMAGRLLDRIVVEVTEHAPVHDYAALEAVLRPYRDAGLGLAVDDAGAGYASLRHVLAVQPDLLKVDMALTRGVDVDPARQTLLRALASFAEPNRCRLVCEGVETGSELRAVHECGVHLAQGYYLARPSATPAWSGYPSLTPGDQLPFDAH
jgi:EAL domain-containing protein (putative c-di-GMP-specific phosphodiesterase class I)